jgi:hypothetical protein
MVAEMTRKSGNIVRVLLQTNVSRLAREPQQLPRCELFRFAAKSVGNTTAFFLNASKI